MKANEQQQNLADAAGQGLSQVICANAGAGCGKTSSIEIVARQDDAAGKNLMALVFAKRNAEELKMRMPSNVTSSTGHSLAWRARHPDVRSPMANVYRGRLTGNLYYGLRDLIKTAPYNRMARDIADSMKMSPGRVVMLMQAVLRNYSQSSDQEIGVKHIPPEAVRHARMKHVGFGDPDFVPTILLASKVFDLMRDPDGAFPVDHSFYLKLCSLKPPRIDKDRIILDEAQDANPAMLAILEHQIKYGTELLLVGDTYQHVYSFTGAIDVMRYMRENHGEITTTMPLTGSYRFGQQVADAGNVYLQMMGAPFELQGFGKSESVSDSRPPSDLDKLTVLYRTNMAALNDVLDFHRSGELFHVVGGVDDLVGLLDGLTSLRNEGWSKHPEIGLFENWKEIVDYSESTEGVAFRGPIDFIEKNKGDVTQAMNALNSAVVESRASRILCTGHKSKGMEWDNVAINADFQRQMIDMKTGEMNLPDEDELSLMYVAATRAKKNLYACGLFETTQMLIDHLKVEPLTDKELAKRSAAPNLNEAMEMMGRAFSPVIVTEKKGDDNVNLIDNVA